MIYRQQQPGAHALQGHHTGVLLLWCSLGLHPWHFWWFSAAKRVPCSSRVFGAGVYAFGAPASRYLEMQYLVQQHNDKGCELRHKGSVLDVAGAQGVEPI